MKRVNFGIVLFIIAGFFTVVLGQNKASIIPGKSGIISMENGDVIKFDRVEETPDGFQYWLDTNPNGVTYAETYQIKQYSGTRAATLAASGALGGLLGGFIGTLGWDESNGLADAKGAYIIGGMVVGGLVGGIVGATQKKQVIVFSKDQSVYLDVFPVVLPETFAENSQVSYGLGLRLNF